MKILHDDCQISFLILYLIISKAHDAKFRPDTKVWIRVSFNNFHLSLPFAYSLCLSYMFHYLHCSYMCNLSVSYVF